MTILASVNNKTLMPGITPIADVPDRPTIGTATAGVASASVTFTASTTGGVPTTFTATSSPGSITGTASSSPITVSGLTGETSYTFTVTAGNSTGTSPASAASNSATPTAPIDGAYDSLASVTLSATTASITFAGIPSGYKHLQIRFIARGAGGGGILTTFNSDTASNYSYHSLTGDGASATANSGATTANILIVRNGGIQTAASTFSAGVIDVLDYADTNKYKTLRTLNGGDANGSGNIQLESGNWRSSVAITSTTLTHNGSGFAANSYFALYGVK
jgi:hypothetical protein